MKTRNILLSVVIAGVTVTVPLATQVPAADRVQKSADANRYSDRDREKAAKDAEDKLEKALKTGEEKAFYRRELEKMGWSISAVNYDKPDYVEYEIVKGDDSYEVQIDFDKNTHKATEVDVALNVWKTDATENALKSRDKVAYPAKTTTDPKRYSDRDREKAAKNDEDKLERALKTGEEKAFYRRELEKMGWSISAVNYDKPDYVEYEIVKGDDSYEVQIDFDKNTHKATEVDVALNVWKTDATENALKSRDKVAYPAKTTTDPKRYSDRDREKAAKNDEDKLERALKTGEEKAFYRRELEKMGWKITSVNYDKADYVEYEIVKGDDSYEVQIDFDKNSHKAKKIDVAMNAWKTDATKKALKQQDRQARR